MLQDGAGGDCRAPQNIRRAVEQVATAEDELNICVAISSPIVSLMCGPSDVFPSDLHLHMSERSEHVLAPSRHVFAPC